MMMITLATAGLLGLIYLTLSFNVSRLRWKTRTNIGDGAGQPGSEALQVAVRSHANFGEYVPLALILMGGIELAGGSHTLLVILGVLLVVGRVLHPLGMMRPAPNPLRAGGAMLTWAMLLIASIAAVTMAL